MLTLPVTSVTEHRGRGTTAPNPEARRQMTTRPATQRSSRTEGRNKERFRLPEPPEREPDEVTAFDHIYQHGNNHHLFMHFGKPDTTLVVADRWIVAGPEFNKARARRPDLLIAFDVSPDDYHASRGYIVSEQGKPPDFIMEVASPSTAEADTGEKRDDYAALGVPEYWRFDETGDSHGDKLAGDRLEGNAYQPMSIDEIAPGVLQGYSPVLNLIIRWDHGQLVWVDPATEAPILTYEDQQARADSEREARIQAEARADAEREARIQAEARAQELSEEIRRLGRQDSL